MIPRYPVYIPSKGRSSESLALTARTLMRDGVPFHVVVEPQEEAEYRALVGESVLVLPFSNLGRGSIPARNWIRDHAIRRGYARHWQLDDNIGCFYRLWEGFRIACHAGVALRVCEDFTDRFERVGVSGLNYDMFVQPAASTGRTPYCANVHVYSCALVSHEMPFVWRGRLNEDTDLCLQALTNGWSTILLNAFMAKKMTTMVARGGNTDELYRRDGEEDARDTFGRYEMARSLERAWPGLVKTIRHFGRYQHSVNWRAFPHPLQLREGLDLGALPEVDEYGLGLAAVEPPRSERIRALYSSYPEVLERASAAEPFWRGLPAFPVRPLVPKLTISFADSAERDRLVAELGVTVDKRFRAKGWSAWWPPREREDPRSLRFVVA